MRIPTGFRSLDKYLGGGLPSSALVVLGARPSVGKTMLSTNLAMYAGSKGHHTIIFALEMAQAQMTERMVKTLAQQPGEDRPHRAGVRQVSAYPN